MADDRVTTFCSNALECRGCGVVRPMPIPCSLERFLEVGQEFEAAHRGCPVTAESAARRDLGARIRSARQRANLTQQQVAEALGVVAPALSHWESGRREPSVTNLRKIAAALGVSVAFLLGEESVDG